MFWTIAALMTVATLAAVLFPLLRRAKPAGPRRAEFDITVYKDQLTEIDRDAERGLLGDAEAKAAIVEIKRRMLKATDTEEGGVGEAGQPSLSRAVAVILCAAVPIVAFGFYIVLGSPNMPDQPYASRDISAEIQQRQGLLEKAEVLQLAGKLVETLKKNPEDIKGWLLLGRTYLTISEFDSGLDAFRRATELSGRRPDVLASYAEAMVLANDGGITPPAKKLFGDILAADPFDPKARYYLGLEKAQNGNMRGAIQDWADLNQLSPPDAPWLDSVNQQIAVAAKELGIDPASIKASARATALGLTRGLVTRQSTRPRSLPQSSMPSAAAPSSAPRGPSAADVKAAGGMSATDRDQMIQSMVKRLADRLKDNPDDLAGWQRLAKAYDVLGDKDKAAAVRKKIEALQK